MPSNHQKKLGGSLPKEIRKPAIILGIEVGLLGAIERNLVEEKLEALLKYYGIPANKPSKWHALCVHLLGELELLKLANFDTAPGRPRKNYSDLVRAIDEIKLSKRCNTSAAIRHLREINPAYKKALRGGSFKNMRN